MHEWKQKRSSMRHYDQQAAIYDVQYVGEQNAKIKVMLKNIKFGSNDLVLDLGCGTGFLFQHIFQRVGFVVGMDVSQNVLRAAKKRIKDMQKINLVRADADNTPFPNHIFDKVFAVTVLQNMPDPTKTIIEMKRTGKPQAAFAVTGLKKKFTQESFVDILEKANLKVVMLTTNQQLKGHVAVCTAL
ncbi:MAG: class I SAM-dependent methyltransferase [Candidatus Bathyarchaeota archaeon]|nr:class I SAM-dependent methyltransferase [Candidatus Bathyarchaeum sp.]